MSGCWRRCKRRRGVLWPPRVRQWVLVCLPGSRIRERRSVWNKGWAVQISLWGFQDAYIVSMWRCLLRNWSWGLGLGEVALAGGVLLKLARDQGWKKQWEWVRLPTMTLPDRLWVAEGCLWSFSGAILQKGKSGQRTGRIIRQDLCPVEGLSDKIRVLWTETWGYEISSCN